MTDTQFQKILEQLADHEKRIQSLEASAESTNKKDLSGETDAANSSKLILSVINKIGDCEESEKIQSKVLDQKKMEAKILLCFFISYKYFKNTWLTTGDIEKITSGLGTKIAVGNVSNKIKGELRQYLESGAVRKRGQPTPYRLNRKGSKRFEEILQSSNG